MELVQTLSTNNKSIIKKLSSIYGIDKCASAIESYAKYIELNKSGNITFGNYNVLIKCSSTYIDSEKLVNVLEELLESNGIINGKHIYIEPRQLKSNLLNPTNRRQDMNRQLFIVSSDLVDLNSSTIQSNLNMCIQENSEDIFIILYKYDKSCWYRNDINIPKLFWKFELDELSEDDKVSYIRSSFKENGITIDNKCSLVNYLKNVECEELQKKLMEIIIKAKSNNISKLTNKSMSELDLRKYLKGLTTSSGKGMQELMNLQGLDNVKTEVQKIVNYIKVNKDRGTTLPSLHMMFYRKARCGKNNCSKNYW